MTKSEITTLESKIIDYLNLLNDKDWIFDSNDFVQHFSVERLVQTDFLKKGDIIINIVDPYYFIYKVMDVSKSDKMTIDLEELATNLHKSSFFKQGNLFKIITDI